MKKLLLLLSLFSLSAFAQMPQLESGDYKVEVRNRAGQTRVCTLNIQNNVATSDLVLNISDCPPAVVNVTLFGYEDESYYMSSKIVANTRRGGFKLYEIHPISTTQFKMISHREYGDGGVGRPRSVMAFKK